MSVTSVQLQKSFDNGWKREANGEWGSRTNPSTSFIGVASQVLAGKTSTKTAMPLIYKGVAPPVEFLTGNPYYNLSTRVASYPCV